MKLVIQFLIGLLFGIGLVISGMSNPQKVLNFLDLAAITTGTWDASLAFVLGGAVLTTFIGYRVVFRQPKPVLDATFHLPTATQIDQPLLYGAAIFGLGWGLSGFCPGPAFTAFGTGAPLAILFVGAMVIGMIVARVFALPHFTAKTNEV